MKRRNVKQILALTLSLVMFGTLAGGCAGKSEESGQPQAEEAGTTGEAEKEEEASQEDLYMIDVIPAGVTPYDMLDTRIGKEIADRFGIGFNFIKYSGDMQEKEAAMLASGDYNEVQLMQTTAISDQYIQAGVLLNLDDYKDLLPDFYERYKKQIPYWRYWSRDGGLYFWQSPVGDDENYIPDVILYYGLSVRTDVLEYYGWPNLVTASDWIEFLKQAVKDFPETYDGTPTVGLTLPGGEAYGMNLLGTLLEEGSTYPGNVGGVNWLYNLETKQCEDAQHSAEKKESLKFFHDCYEAGVLDPELFTDNHDMTVEKMSNGSAIAVWYVNWNNKTANQALTEAGHPEMSYITQPIQLDSQEGQKFMVTKTFLYPFNQYGVTDKCKDPERFFKFLNWCCTEEGQLLLQNGIEGVHYEIQDGERVPTDLYLEMLRDPDLQNKEGLPGGLATGSYEMFQCLPYDMSVAEDGKPYNLGGIRSYIDEFALTDREKEAYAGLGWETSAQWWVENAESADAHTVTVCNIDAASDLGKLEAKLNELYQKSAGQIVMADDFEGAYAEMLSEYEKLDYQSVIDARNAMLEEITEQLEAGNE